MNLILFLGDFFGLFGSTFFNTASSAAHQIFTVSEDAGIELRQDLRIFALPVKRCNHSDLDLIHMNLILAVGKTLGERVGYGNRQFLGIPVPVHWYPHSRQKENTLLSRERVSLSYFKLL
jgi:hypothetical protein